MHPKYHEQPAKTARPSWREEGPAYSDPSILPSEDVVAQHPRPSNSAQEFEYTDAPESDFIAVVPGPPERRHVKSHVAEEESLYYVEEVEISAPAVQPTPAQEKTAVTGTSLSHLYQSFAKRVGLDTAVERAPSPQTTGNSPDAQEKTLLQEQSRKQQEDIRRLEEQNRQLLASQDSFTQKMHQEVYQARDQARRAQEQVSMLVREREALTRRLQDAEVLLAARKEELRIAQSFMTTADQFSIADIKMAVEELNEDIYQTSALIGDEVLDATTKFRMAPETEDQAGRRRKERSWVEKRWGVECFKRVRDEVEGGDTVLLEALIQSIFSECCAELVGTYRFLGDRRGGFIDRLWEDVRRENKTSIANNWLSLTHAQLKKQEISHFPVFRRVERLMLAVGWRRDDADQQKFSSILQEKVRDIAEAAMKVKSMCIEGLLSAYLTPLLMNPGVAFNPGSMVDAEARRGAGDYEAHTQEPEESVKLVMCTTGMGLLQVVKDDSARGGEAMSVIMKAKVTLRAVTVRRESTK